MIKQTEPAKLSCAEQDAYKRDRYYIKALWKACKVIMSEYNFHINEIIRINGIRQDLQKQVDEHEMRRDELLLLWYKIKNNEQL